MYATRIRRQNFVEMEKENVFPLCYVVFKKYFAVGEKYSMTTLKYKQVNLISVSKICSIHHSASLVVDCKSCTLRFDSLVTYSIIISHVLHTLSFKVYHKCIYSIICLLRLLCIPDSCLIRPKILVPIIFPYTSMLKHLCYTDPVNSEFRPYLAVPND